MARECPALNSLNEINWCDERIDRMPPYGSEVVSNKLNNFNVTDCRLMAASLGPYCYPVGLARWESDFWLNKVTIVTLTIVNGEYCSIDSDKLRSVCAFAILGYNVYFENTKKKIFVLLWLWNSDGSRMNVPSLSSTLNHCHLVGEHRGILKFRIQTICCTAPGPLSLPSDRYERKVDVLSW